MPLGDHLEELRRRLLFAVLGLVPIVCTALYFGEDLLALLITPVQDALRNAGQPGILQATGPLETFSTYISVSIIAAIIVGAPWMLYQLWLFITPGLYERERRFVYILLPLSALLTCTAILFLFRVIMPIVLTFLVSFGTQVGMREQPHVTVPLNTTLTKIVILAGDPDKPAPGDEWINTILKERRVCIAVDEKGVPEILATPVSKDVTIAQQYRVTQYVDLLTTLTLAFAAGFQTPVVVLVLGWAGLVTPAFLAKYRKQAVLVTAIAAAAATPGDPTSMVFLWIPLMLLYELGGLLLRFFPAHRVSKGFTKGQRARAALEDRRDRWFPEDDARDERKEREASQAREDREERERRDARAAREDHKASASRDTAYEPYQDNDFDRASDQGAPRDADGQDTQNTQDSHTIQDSNQGRRSVPRSGSPGLLGGPNTDSTRGGLTGEDWPDDVPDHGPDDLHNDLHNDDNDDLPDVNSLDSDKKRPQDPGTPPERTP